MSVSLIVTHWLTCMNGCSEVFPRRNVKQLIDLWNNPGFSKFDLHRLSNFPGCQMAYMIDFAVLFLESLLTLVTHVLFCYLYLSAHVVDLVQICYPCIVMLLWLFYTLEHTQWRSDPINHKCYLAACYIRQLVKMNLEIHRGCFWRRSC